MSAEQQRVADLVVAGKSVFFTGCAGTLACPASALRIETNLPHQAPVECDAKSPFWAGLMRQYSLSQAQGSRC